jgi:hypothetical protein
VGRLYDADEDWRSAGEEDVDVDNFATSAKKEDLDEDEG